MSALCIQGMLVLAGALFASLWQGALIVGVFWLGLRCLPKIGSATRYAAWLCALVSLVLLPAFTVGVSLRSSNSAGSVPATGTQHVLVLKVMAPLDRDRGSQIFGMVKASTDAAPGALGKPLVSAPRNVAIAATIVWLLVACGRLLQLLLDLRELAALRRGAWLWSREYAYPVFLSDAICVPLAVGFLRPAILLPATLVDRLAPGAVQAIVVHEAAHLRRYDVWTNALARVAEVFLALNPAAWFVSRRLSLEREIACDDWVVEQTGAGDVFAHALAAMARNTSLRIPLAAPSAFGSRHTVVERIERVLDSNPRRLRLSFSALGAMLMLLAMVAFTLQSISPALALSTQAPPETLSTGSTTGSTCVHVDRGPVLVHMVGPGGQSIYTKPVPPDRLPELLSKPPATATTFEIDVDAAGRAHKITVLHPSRGPGKDLHTLQEFVKNAPFLPALHDCAPIAGTFRSGWLHIPGRRLLVMAVPTRSASTRGEAGGVGEAAHAATPGRPCSVPYRKPAVLQLVWPTIPESQKNFAPPVPWFGPTVHVDLDSAGGVTSARVIHSSGRKAFDEAGLVAAKQTTYAPAAANCKPVASSFNLALGLNDIVGP